MSLQIDEWAQFRTLAALPDLHTAMLSPPKLHTIEFSGELNIAFKPSASAFIVRVATATLQEYAAPLSAEFPSLFVLLFV